MKFLLGFIAGVILASAAGLWAQESGYFWTPGGKSGSYSHNPVLGSTWVQDSQGNAGYIYSTPTPHIGQRNPC